MVDNLLCILKEFFYWIIEALLDVLYFLFGWLLALLPNSPFQFEPIQWGAFGNLIGVFLPIADILKHFTFILTAVGLYLVARHLLRIVRMVK